MFQRNVGKIFIIVTGARKSSIEYSKLFLKIPVLYNLVIAKLLLQFHSLQSKCFFGARPEQNFVYRKKVCRIILIILVTHFNIKYPVININSILIN